MKNIILILILTTAFVACSKKNSNENTADISYTLLSPNIHLNTVDSFTNYPGSPCAGKPFRVPEDSLVSYNLDLNSDGQPDFKIIMKHEMGYSSPSDPCPQYDSSIEIYGLHPLNQIARTSSMEIVLMNPDEVIDETLLWQNRQFLEVALTQGGGYYSFDFSGDKYIGLKLNEQYGWLFVNKTEHNLYIKGYALNQNPNEEIQSGQQ